MYGALDISTSGLIAQRTRLTVASANLMNARTLLNADGAYEPYRRRSVLLGVGDPERSEPLGVHVEAIEIDDGPLRKEYEPESPYADEAGYVEYPNISSVVEQMNSMQALRSYEANIATVEATKSMMSVALQMLG